MKRLYIILLLISTSSILPGQIRKEDKIRIREAIEISRQLGGNIWDGLNEPPFSILLIMDDFEYLIDHNETPDDFRKVGFDTLLNTIVYKRPTQMNKAFLATFPFAGINTIVIGTPENTGLNSTQWIITLLHERFHQYQYSSPGYFSDLNRLDLSNGDKTGMWQLNYPFPYENPQVNTSYKKFTSSLQYAVLGRDTDAWNALYDSLKNSFSDFKKSLGEKDYKYLAFQWYQEGIARYTEYAFLKSLITYEPSKAVRNLPNFIDFNLYEEEFTKDHIGNVTNLELAEYKRETAYDVGFALGLILDVVHQGWQAKYQDSRFDITQLLK